MEAFPQGQVKYVYLFYSVVFQTYIIPIGNMDSASEEETHLDYDSRVLLHFCKAEEHLIHTYCALSALSCDVEMKQGQSDIENLEEVCSKTCLSSFSEPYLNLQVLTF